MNRTLALFGIGLVFGGGIGFTLAAANGVTFDGHDHAQHGSMDHAAMDHGKMHETPLEVSRTDAPQLDIEVTPDPVTGYNLHLMTRGFTFAPEHASLDHVAGQGHAHVYVNGTKIGRLYSPWMHLDALPSGATEIQVTLNANDHRPLAVSGTPVTATTIVEIS